MCLRFLNGNTNVLHGKKLCSELRRNEKANVCNHDPGMQSSIYTTVALGISIQFSRLILM